MTEVEMCGGGHRTWLRNQLVSLWGAPSPIYKGVEEGGGPALYGAPWRSPTPTGSRIPPSLVGVGEEGRRREGEGKGGWPPTQFGLGLGEGRALHLATSSSLPLRPNKAHTLPGGFR